MSLNGVYVTVKEHQVFIIKLNLQSLLPLLMATLPCQASGKQLASRPPAVFQPCPGRLQGALQGVGGGEMQGGAGAGTSYSRRHKTGGINTLLLWL